MGSWRWTIIYPTNLFANVCIHFLIPWKPRYDLYQRQDPLSALYLTCTKTLKQIPFYKAVTLIKSLNWTNDSDEFNKFWHLLGNWKSSPPEALWSKSRFQVVLTQPLLTTTYIFVIYTVSVSCKTFYLLITWLQTRELPSLWVPDQSNPLRKQNPKRPDQN